MDGIWGDDSSASSAAATSASAVAPNTVAAQENAEVAKLYNEALADLNGNSLKSALRQFGEVERQYPYSTYATQSILMQAYIGYRLGKWDDAINAANRYITLHPGGKDVGYAYYLVAICTYDQIANTKRDQSATQKAVASLEEVAQRFPERPMRRTLPPRCWSRATTWPARKWKSAATTIARVPIWQASTASRRS